MIIAHYRRTFREISVATSASVLVCIMYHAVTCATWSVWSHTCYFVHSPTIGEFTKDRKRILEERSVSIVYDIKVSFTTQNHAIPDISLPKGAMRQRRNCLSELWNLKLQRTLGKLNRMLNSVTFIVSWKVKVLSHTFIDFFASLCLSTKPLLK